MRDFLPELDVAAVEANGDRIRVTAAAMNGVVALTDRDLVLCSTRAFGYHPGMRRYPLKSLTGARFVRDAEGALLSLEFRGTADDLMLSFRAEEIAGAQDIVRMLEPRVGEVVRFNWETPLPPTSGVVRGGSL